MDLAYTLGSYQEYYLLYLDEKFQCSDHPDCQMKAIHLGEQSTFKSRILCIQCILSNQDKNSSTSIFQIREFLINPTKVIDQIEQDRNKQQNLKYITNMYQDLLKELKNLQMLIQQSIKNIEEQYQKYDYESDQNKKQLLEKIKYNEFQELFSIVWQMDTHQGTNEYNKLQQYFDWLALNIRQIVQTSVDENFSNQLLINQFIFTGQIIDQHIQNIRSNVNAFPLDIAEFPQIHHEISQGKLINYQLIYQGSIDGLNSTSYWKKINNQSQLLTFMTSRNGNQFGGYCPLESKINGLYLHDKSLRSFIFQYNKKELYKQFVEDYTTYCSKECGPVYGTHSGNDLLILQDFQQGHTQGLGDHFDISKYKIEDKTTHIFGDKQPNLIECKVYKITFL
ncbi:hypothetical protein pb186bvf_002908 [Paramecium bursaria]